MTEPRKTHRFVEWFVVALFIVAVVLWAMAATGSAYYRMRVHTDGVKMGSVVNELRGGR